MNLNSKSAVLSYIGSLRKTYSVSVSVLVTNLQIYASRTSVLAMHHGEAGS